MVELGRADENDDYIIFRWEWRSRRWVMNRCISLLFPCYSLFRILPFRQMSLFILTFLQILAVAPPPLQGFTGGKPMAPAMGCTPWLRHDDYVLAVFAVADAAC
jgi:hypothetical protein